eukprot:Skav226954  [mRNA]  locus=scaffold51:330:788:+ [translate_table: standard]
MVPAEESSDEEERATTRRRRGEPAAPSEAAPAAVPVAVAAAPAAGPVPAGPVPAALREEEGSLKLSETISRAHVFVAGVSEGRLSQQLELLNPMFDSTMTCDLTKEGLLMMVWIVTRVKPNILLSSLRHLAKVKFMFKFIALETYVAEKVTG